MTARWFSALPMTRLRTIAAQPSGSSVRRYCSRRSSTLPETGPSTRARNLPCSVRKVTATPFLGAEAEQRRAERDPAEADHAAQRVDRHAGALGAVDRDHDVGAVLAQVRALGGDVEGVEVAPHAVVSVGGSVGRLGLLDPPAQPGRDRAGAGEPLRPAELEQRAGVAALALVDRRRRAAGGEQRAGGRGDLAGEAAQLVVERDRVAPAHLAVEQGALGHGVRKTSPRGRAPGRRAAPRRRDGPWAGRACTRPDRAASASPSRVSSTTSATPATPSARERIGMLCTIRRSPRLACPGLSLRSCRMRPSAVSTFSAHSRSTWISAHCRGQNR